MSWTERISGEHQCYWKLADANSNNGDGRNLSTSGTVNFVQGSLGNCADFGSSGTSNGLYYGSNVMSFTTPADFTVNFRFQLNSTSNTSRNHAFFHLSTVPTGTGGTEVLCFYTISSGTMSITIRQYTGVGSGFNDATINMTADTNWHRVMLRSRVTDGSSEITVYNYSGQISSQFILSTFGSRKSSPTVFLAIGNARPLTISAFAKIDDVWISEGASKYSDESATAIYNRRIYNTEAIGYLI